MKTVLVAYGAAALAMLCLDAVWLTLAADRLYRPLLGDILLPEFRLVPAILFYLLYVAGAVIFAVRPALAAGHWTVAAGYGALLGFFCYATYDLTNQATLKTWPTTVTVFDMGWGTLLTACAATAGYLAASRFTRRD
ncbi:DUF2177 family protein [soil metagenome]